MRIGKSNNSVTENSTVGRKIVNSGFPFVRYCLHNRQYRTGEALLVVQVACSVTLEMSAWFALLY